MIGIVGCEESQAVTKAFRALGHEFYSVDLKPCSGGHPEWHMQMDVFEALKIVQPEFGLFHPTCTRLTNAGVLRLYINGKKENGIEPFKWQEMIEAAEFFKKCLEWVNKNKGGVENPIPHGHAMKIIGQKYSQIIQPYNFGENASKATCLWLNRVSLLKNTSYCEPRYVDGRPRWANQTDGGQNNVGPSKKYDRAEVRSKTYLGVAKAMAEQWGVKQIKSNVGQQLNLLAA